MRSLFYRGGVFRRRVAAIASLGVVILAGCGPVPEKHSASSSAKPTSVFATKSEALSAARDAYEKYLRVTQQVSEDGGAGVQRLDRIVTPAELQAEVETAAYLKQHALRSVGPTVLVKFKLQEADLATGEVKAYACTDLSAVRVIDKAGADVTPKNRPDRQTSVPNFSWHIDRLLLAGDESWSGESIC